jgi:hypothetical protein
LVSQPSVVPASSLGVGVLPELLLLLLLEEPPEEEELLLDLPGWFGTLESGSGDGSDELLHATETTTSSDGQPSLVIMDASVGPTTLRKERAR